MLFTYSFQKICSQVNKICYFVWPLLITLTFMAKLISSLLILGDPLINIDRIRIYLETLPAGMKLNI